MPCHECVGALLIHGHLTQTEQCLVERYASALRRNNFTDMGDLLEDTRKRMHGICICSAKSYDQCICKE